MLKKINTLSEAIDTILRVNEYNARRYLLLYSAWMILGALTRVTDISGSSWQIQNVALYCIAFSLITLSGLLVGSRNQFREDKLPRTGLVKILTSYYLNISLYYLNISLLLIGLLLFFSNFGPSGTIRDPIGFWAFLLAVIFIVFKSGIIGGTINIAYTVLITHFLEKWWTSREKKKSDPTATPPDR